MTKRLNGLAAVSVLRDEGMTLDNKKYATISGSHRHTIFAQRTPGVNLVSNSTTLGIKFNF